MTEGNVEKTIAVVGAGAAGLTAAWLLARRHRVTLFERETRLGGHAWTYVVPNGPDAGTPLDLGFMVLNQRNYPIMGRLLDALGGVERRESEMSFGYQSRDGGVQYALNWRPEYALSAPRPPAPALLGEILRFFRRAEEALDAGVSGGYGDWLAASGFSDSFVSSYALPMGAALWSCAPGQVLRMPAAFVLGFYRHHGMLGVADDGPRWQTLVGGSRSYVDRLRASFRGEVLLGRAPVSLARTSALTLTFADGATEAFDEVVLATHADEALALLVDPSVEEAAALGAWRYQRTKATLHSDPSVMPADRGAWASWNYVEAESDGPTLTYHLDRLQGPAGLSRPYFLTLGPAAVAEPLLEASFTHPLYDEAAVASQAALRSLNGTKGTWFAGSYLGNGFHEDAVAAGAAVAASLGCPL